MAGVKTEESIPLALALATDDLPYADDWLGYPGVRLKADFNPARIVGDDNTSGFDERSAP